MSERELKSKCCNASVRVEGRTTLYYVCEACGKATDTTSPSEPLSQKEGLSEAPGQRTRK